MMTAPHRAYRLADATPSLYKVSHTADILTEKELT
jgi:hypothetical protein